MRRGSHRSRGRRLNSRSLAFETCLFLGELRGTKIGGSLLRVGLLVSRSHALDLLQNCVGLLVRRIEVVGLQRGFDVREVFVKSARVREVERREELLRLVDSCPDGRFSSVARIGLTDDGVQSGLEGVTGGAASRDAIAAQVVHGSNAELYPSGCDAAHIPVQSGQRLIEGNRFTFVVVARWRCRREPVRTPLLAPLPVAGARILGVGVVRLE